MAKFGVSLDDDLADRIEDRRVGASADGSPEVRSRSAVIAEFVELGVIAHDVLEASELDLPNEHARKAFVRQALLNELDREGFDEPESM